MKLYNYFRSGTSHRLRIALRLKNLDAEYVAIDLRKDEHLLASFKSINPQGLVPALEFDGQILFQSPAIIEWLEEVYPEPPLLPADPDGRARVQALAAIVGCDIHPVNNRRILESLRKNFSANEEAIDRWVGTWISEGFDVLEVMLGRDSRRGRFCYGDRPSFADVYLIPQIESSRRFKVDLTRWPLISAVNDACAELIAFQQAKPSAQPDA